MGNVLEITKNVEEIDILSNDIETIPRRTCGVHMNIGKNSSSTSIVQSGPWNNSVVINDKDGKITRTITSNDYLLTFKSPYNSNFAYCFCILGLSYGSLSALYNLTSGGPRILLRIPVYALNGLIIGATIDWLHS